jgi:hypothetical protein
MVEAERAAKAGKKGKKKKGGKGGKKKGAKKEKGAKGIKKKDPTVSRAYACSPNSRSMLGNAEYRGAYSCNNEM